MVGLAAAALFSAMSLGGAEIPPARVAPGVESPRSARDAAIDPAVRAWFESRLADLNADDLERRDAAGADLAADPRAELSLIEAYVGQNGSSAVTLSPEQRERLWRIGYQRFLNSPRAAMGVSFARFDGAGGGVEISGTVAGFDAGRVLEPGDVIRSMNGAPVNVNDDARATILSHDPEDEVSVEVLRRGEARVVTLRLGRFDQLRNAADPDDAVMAAAWERRCARRAGVLVQPPVLDAGLTPERWAALSMERPSRPERRDVPAIIRPRNVAIAPGVAGREEELEPAGVLAGGEARVVPEIADPDFALRLGDLAQRHPEINNLTAQIANARVRIQRNEQRLRAGNLQPWQRRNLEQESVALRSNIAFWRQRLKQIDDQARLMGR